MSLRGCLFLIGQNPIVKRSLGFDGSRKNNVLKIYSNLRVVLSVGIFLRPGVRQIHIG